VSNTDSFQDLINGIRAGDEKAAVDLVRQFESVIRCQVRLHLTDPRMCRLFDTADICQTVLKSFFFRAALGQYDLDSPAQLVKLLVTMTRNKIASLARKQRVRAADQRRTDTGALDNLAGSTAESPSNVVANRDLLEAAKQRLSADERRMAELWAQGYGWPHIAAELGGSPNARRMQLVRALDRVARELGIEEDSDA
jgi:RNA polymerase sigma-70 factor (ECF subfamily)